MNLYSHYLFKIKKTIQDNKRNINFDSEKVLNSIVLESPPDKFNFDLSSNAALILSKNNKIDAFSHLGHIFNDSVLKLILHNIRHYQIKLLFTLIHM